MSAAFMFKLVIILLLIIILISLSSGIFFLVKDEGQTNRVVQSLTVRIALSITLFILLFVGFRMGWIQPHGLHPEQPAQTEKALPE